MFSPDQWAASTGAAFYNGVATQSLRFDDGSSAHLSRTPSASNRKTHVLSMWVKRSNLGINTSLLRVNGSGDTGRTDIWFDTNDKLLVAGSSTYFRITSQVFRDTSSWYHLVFALDTTQTTLSNNFLIYLNGSQITSFATNNNYSLDTDYGINGNVEHQIGEGYGYFDGYMAEINFIDGLSFFSDTSGTPNTAFNINSFGEFKNGVWIAKEYTGSYGTNGFRLQFNQTGTGSASSSTIGADTSGNDNHFSSSGIVASDCSLLDSPENNFCTLSSIQNQTSSTLSEGNLKAVGTSANWDNLQSTFAVSSGKWYWEVKATSVSEANSFVAGIHQTGFPAQNLHWFSASYTASSYGIVFGILDPDFKVTNGNNTAFTLGIATNDILQFRLNLDDNELSISIDGSDKGKLYDITANVEYTPALCLYNTSSATMNFGQDSTFAGTETAGGNADENGNGDFAYAPPTGYLALCSANLPEPTISPNADTQADDYFNTATYSGNSSTQDITSVGFQPDWVWIKSRSNASNHYLTDVIRGTSKGLQTNITNAEVTNTNVITSFNSDGFSLGNDATANVANITGRTYVSWNWKAGGTAVSNTDGSITSSVSANTDAGFSIVSYTGTDSATETIGHGLGAVPAMLIIKSRDSALNWAVYHKGSDATAPEDYLLRLNTTDARVDVSSSWNDTAPTSSVFTVGTSSLVNNTDDFIAYCFAEIEGYSKFGSYNSNSSADGTMIYLGFRPKWVLIKKIDGSASWWLVDAVRDTYNPTDNYILPDTSDTDRTYTTADFLSNGFKIRNTSTAFNSGTHIYMAFAENPFKYANAR